MSQADAIETPAVRERGRARSTSLLILGAFVLASALAGALGAINLGTALSFGQIALALTRRVRAAAALSDVRESPSRADRL